MKNIYLILFAFLLVQTGNAQLQTTIVGKDTACISSQEQYSVEVATQENNYLFRDTSQNLSNHLALDAGYDHEDITNTFTYDLWVKPTRSINIYQESNACAGDVSVPLANSGQNWAIVPSAINNPNMSVGLSIGTNGLMVGEHSGNILVSRLSHIAFISGWVHVGITYRTDSIFLYLDGELVSKRATDCPSNPKCLAKGITGNYYSPNFQGDIDEFRIWDIPLNQEQINLVKDKKFLNQVSGLRYYASFDNGKFERTLGDIGTPKMTNNGLNDEGNLKKSTLQLNSYTGTDIHHLNELNVNELEYLWSNGETSNTTLYTPTDTSNKLSVTVHNATFSKTDSILIIGEDCNANDVTDTVIVYDTASCSNAVLHDENLVSYYPFQNNAYDLGSAQNDATVHGAQLTRDKDGEENSAYYFDGTDDYLLIPDSLPITDNFTISFWAKSERTSGYGNILCDGSVDHGGNDFLINFRGNEIGIRADKSGKRLNHEDFGPSELSGLDIANKWVHVTWTMNPDYSKVYLNGEEIAQINTAGTNLGYHDGESYIGARQVWSYPAEPDNYFKGALDEIRIYDKELPAETIKAIYKDVNNIQTHYDTVTTHVYDTTFVTVNDTMTVTDTNQVTVRDTITVTDTNYVTVRDTISVTDTNYVTVTDTLLIDAVLTDISSANYTNTIKVYPNPAKDHVFINTGRYDLMEGYRIKIFNQSGNTVFDTRPL